MKKFIVLFFIFILSFHSSAQIKITGTVVDSEKKPLPGASVYFNNTSIGTTTDSEGFFQLHVSEGTYDLIVSFIGYHTLQYKLDTKTHNKSLTISILPKNNVLDEVVIHSKKKKQKDNRYRNYDFRRFRNNFLGKTKLSKECKILNPEVLEFYVDEETKAFTVETLAPIQIENKGLGYKITYDLISFELANQRIQYLGYSRVENLKGKKRKQRRWKKNRLKAYKGSLTHFINSLQSANTREEGFIIHQFKRVLTPNFPTDNAIKKAKKVIRHNKEKGFIVDYYRSIPNPKTALDSALVVLQKSRQKKFTIEYIKKDVDYSDILFRIDKKIFLKFDHHLQIIYTKEKEEYGYRRGRTRLNQQQSVFTLLTDYVRVLPNGQIASPLEVLVEKYWGYEKFGNALPLDYVPPKD